MTRPAASDKPLSRYNEKRNFKVTSEPSGIAASRRQARALAYVIQKHWASHLHYDFRLELDGVLLSWAVPKGPSFDPAVKQMAIHVEDHPLSYASFEGHIPKGEYGAGTVIVWDRGSWEPVGDARAALQKGKLVFTLHGEKLAGLWELVRISKPDVKKDQWLLLKKRGDRWARPVSEYDVITALPDSVIEKPLGPVAEREPRPSPAPGARRATPDRPDLSRAVKAALPPTLEPQLATLVSGAPVGGTWVVENKFDGYRLLARLDQGKARLFTRRGNDWTAKLADLATAIEALELDAAWLDGEIVVLGEGGVPDFNRLQNAIDNARSKDIVYFVFDAPFLGGMDLRQVPLASRRAALGETLSRGVGGQPSERVRFSQAFDAPPAQVLEAACQIGLEGVMLKRADAAYVSARSDTWLKLKCQQRQEFVVVGFTERSGAPSEIGNLLLAYYEDGKLHYAGALGTGWSAEDSRGLRAQLAKLVVDEPAIDPQVAKPGRWSRRTGAARHWIKPEVVVEVVFGEWTPDGHIRHASFRGVRLDKPASAVTRERARAPAAPPASSAAAAATRVTSVKVSNPDRIIDPSTGAKKVQLVRYYESVAEWMLPHLKDRPISLLRAPDGIDGQHFFQKHAEVKMPGMKELDPALWPGHSALLAVDSVEALVSAAQMNTVEFHTWNSTIKRIDEPDRMIFDLDPGQGVTWSHLQEAAELMRTLLSELGLNAWLKTSGGKGLHVVVPLARKFDYAVVKGFSQAIVQHMAKTIPQRFVAKSGGANRVGKIFIDYLRNGHGQTTVAAFSARARPGMGVSMPVSWERLPTLKSAAQWTIASAREYLSFEKDDPWAAYWKSRQSLTRAMQALAYKP